ncbi:hypothetical protein DFH29DRAFT_817297 [Suillus ampliporus]|nr:hypothetical protein DFH29DRAFT_817297 [Suillus ampliporus]
MPGELTPEVACAWDMACQNYFTHKEVPANVQVKKVAWGMLDPCMQDCELQATWLDSDWAAQVRKKLLCSTQGTHAFVEWAAELQSVNALLTNKMSYLNKTSMRHQLEANMNDDLATDCRHEGVNDEQDLKRWMEKVK